MRPLLPATLLPSALWLLLLIPACERPGAGPAEPASDAAATATPDPVLVRVRPLSRGDVDLKLEATAHVASLDVVDLMPERAEVVKEILAEEGDVVQAGQVLARLRDTQASLAVDEAKVALEEARITMEQAKRELERDQALVAEQGPTGVLADRDLESRRQTYEVARTAFQSKEVALKQAQISLDQCELRSPIAGTVTLRDISVGDMTAIGTRAFQITDLASPKVILYRPQRELASLRVGQALTATSEALPGQRIQGHIERIAPVVDQETGTVKVTCALEPPAGLIIPNGILLRLTLTLETHHGALLVPKEALLYEGRGVSCFVVKDGHAVQHALDLGFERQDAFEILHPEGLAVGDEVVVVGADKLADGDLVEVAAE